MEVKEKILKIALDLFSKYGYAGTSIRMLAKKVGFSEAALYKHYSSKMDLFLAIVEIKKEEIRNFYKELNVPETSGGDIAKAYNQITLKELNNIAEKLFLFFTENTGISNYRRLLQREQFSNKEISKIYNEQFLSGVIKFYSKTFDVLIKSKVFIDSDPLQVALEFYSPIYFLIQMYDTDEKEIKKLLTQLNSHINNFSKRYLKSWER